MYVISEPKYLIKASRAFFIIATMVSIIHDGDCSGRVRCLPEWSDLGQGPQTKQQGWSISKKKIFCSNFLISGGGLVSMAWSSLPTPTHYNTQNLRSYYNQNLKFMTWYIAWKIPWTEEPSRLQSMGSRRVRHNWATSLSCIGEGNGNPLQCSCLENPRYKGAWWAAVYGVTQSWTRLKWLSSSSTWFRQ